MQYLIKSGPEMCLAQAASGPEDCAGLLNTNCAVQGQFRARNQPFIVYMYLELETFAEKF